MQQAQVVMFAVHMHIITVLFYCGKF